jgi:FADH2 O2-dependent halogenase
MFTSLTLLYFAAASYSESARRLNRNKSSHPNSFLLLDHPSFGPTLRSCLEQAKPNLPTHERLAVTEQICRAIDPINLAGLGRPERRNWYAPKLGVDKPTVVGMLRTCGFSVD